MPTEGQHVLPRDALGAGARGHERDGARHYAAAGSWVTYTVFQSE